MQTVSGWWTRPSFWAWVNQVWNWVKGEGESWCLSRVPLCIGLLVGLAYRRREQLFDSQFVDRWSGRAFIQMSLEEEFAAMRVVLRRRNGDTRIKR